MGRVLLFTLLAVSLGGLLAVTGAARSHAPAGFRLADGSAGCAFDGSRLACRTAAMPRAVVLEADGSSGGADVAVDWNDATTVLRQAESWWHAGFSCRVDEGDIACEAGDGSITVGRTGVGGASSMTSP